MPIKSFRDLTVWQKSMSLAEGVYAAVRLMPASERFELGSQLRRSAVSIPSNIAEGRGRARTKPLIHHLVIALGSEAELQTQLELSIRLGFISPERGQPLIQASAEVGRMLAGLITTLERRGPAPPNS